MYQEYKTMNRSVVQNLIYAGVYSDLIKECTVRPQRSINERLDAAQVNPLAHGTTNFLNQLLHNNWSIINLL